MGASAVTSLKNVFMVIDHRSGETGRLVRSPVAQTPATSASRELYPGFRLGVCAKAAHPLSSRECFPGSSPPKWVTDSRERSRGIAHEGQSRRRLTTGMRLVAHRDGVPVGDPYPDFLSSKLFR